MTKADIVHALHDRLTGLTKREAAVLVDAVFEIMKETLGRGEKVKISGFGNFVPRDKRSALTHAYRALAARMREAVGTGEECATC
jgi:nucleoid DNA-binding protein